MGPGVYYDTVFVRDPDAVNNPQYTVITLTIYETDHVYVETISAFAGEHVEVVVGYDNSTTTGVISLPLNFNNTDVLCDSAILEGTRLIALDESVITIDNVNGTVHLYGFTIGGPILGPGSGTILRMFFTVSPTAPAQFVPIDSGFIPPIAVFEFTDAGGVPKETNFTSGGIDISDTPCFDFPTDTVAFEFDLGGVVPSISFPITNTCSGLLEWSVTDGAGWLVMSPTSGVQDEQVTFNIDTTGLTPGSYVTTATFESNGENTPYTVVVTLNLRAVPIIMLSPAIIDLGQVCGGDTVNGSFDIINTGHATLDWHADAAEVLALSDYSGTAPSTVSFQLITELLEFGHHSLDVVVTSAEAINSPQTLTIKVFIINCDECTFDIAEVDGTQGLPVGVPIYTSGIEDVAGLQFNIAYNAGLVEPDSVTSDYMPGPTVGVAGSQIHYVWDDIVNPITVPDGGTIMTLWVTVIGDIGEINCFEWAGVNEITDPYGIPYEGVTYCGGCMSVLSPFYSLSGNIVYYDMSQAVPGMNIDLSGDAVASTTTDEHGDYVFTDLPTGNYAISPSRTDDDPGVSVGDVIKIRRHIAFVEEFASPYKMIAADVNGSAGVTVADVVLIRRYLAELDVLPLGNWACVDADFIITMDNWYNAPHHIDVSVSDKDMEMLDFTAARMGDVNATWTAPPPSARAEYSVSVELTIPDLIVAPSDHILVPVVVSNFSAVAGVEIHVTFDMAQTGVDSITSPVMDAPTVNSVDGRAHIIWEDFENPLTLSDGDTLVCLYLHIMPTATGDLPLVFMGNCELTDEIGDPYSLGLNNGTLLVTPLDADGESALLPMEFELKQNYPNPFNPATTISYTIDRTMALTIEVYNVSGQVVDRIDLGRKAPGTYSVTYSGVSLPSGVYTYRLIGDGISAARQMLLVK
jgi:hypothetical protein